MAINLPSPVEPISAPDGKITPTWYQRFNDVVRHLNNHPSSAKAWVNFGINGGIRASYNVTSVTDDGVGFWTVNIATDFSSANYVGFVTGDYKSGTGGIMYNIGGIAAGSFAIFGLIGNTLSDPNATDVICFVGFGDQ